MRLLRDIIGLRFLTRYREKVDCRALKEFTCSGPSTFLLFLVTEDGVVSFILWVPFKCFLKLISIYLLLEGCQHLRVLSNNQPLRRVLKVKSRGYTVPAAPPTSFESIEKDAGFLS